MKCEEFFRHLSTLLVYDLIRQVKAFRDDFETWYCKTGHQKSRLPLLGHYDVDPESFYLLKAVRKYLKTQIWPTVERGGEPGMFECETIDCLLRTSAEDVFDFKSDTWVEESPFPFSSYLRNTFRQRAVAQMVKEIKRAIRDEKITDPLKLHDLVAEHILNHIGRIAVKYTRSRGSLTDFVLSKAAAKYGK
ncbi:MAG: hypothetical protein WCV85_05920 [Patescibacteria group bacterium]|jgi:hypothetical protein